MNYFKRWSQICYSWYIVDLESKIIHIDKVRVRAGKNVVLKQTKIEKSQRSLYIPDEVFHYY